MKYSLTFLAIAAAAQASPMPVPQGVTADISPVDTAPAGCIPNYSGSFGITVQNITVDAQSQAKRAVSQISDGQVQASTGTNAPGTMAPVTQIGDGQIQATVAPKTMAAVTQIGDGQIQATAAPKTMAAVTQIGDGQIQATAAPKPAPSASTAQVLSQISDGQVQATNTASVASQINDGQVQAQATSTAQASGQAEMVGCGGDGVLTLTLDNGVLLDDQNRTGYIASNYQFQFDAPAQAGAIYTSGWSVCGNGSLALGGQTTFWQCLSGSFYNLYSENWAPQCNPVTLDVLRLVDCDA